jgi:hypothetical protein
MREKLDASRRMTALARIAALALGLSAGAFVRASGAPPSDWTTAFGYTGTEVHAVDIDGRRFVPWRLPRPRPGSAESRLDPEPAGSYKVITARR